MADQHSAPDAGGRGGCGCDDSALLACEVATDRAGHWVELTVGFSDAVVTHRVGPYLTERAARVAAVHISRAVGRTAPLPLGF